MRVLAIPVKPFERSKRRLARLLSPQERAALSLVMFREALEACLAQPGWEVWVVSRDPAALETAARRGARPVVETGRSLQGAVRQVEQEMGPSGRELAVLLADLPLVSGASVASALGAGAGGSPAVAAVPAASDGGTNLLLRRPAGAIPARFGRSSFARHRAEAEARALPFVEVADERLGFDLDRPEDVRVLLGTDRPSRTRAACLEMGLEARLRVGA